MRDPVSHFALGRYVRRWGWDGAKRAYAVWAAAENKKAGSEKYPVPSLESPDPGRRVPPRLRFAVFRRDGYRCAICGAPANEKAGVRLQIDHIVPLSKGGPTRLDNLQTLCSTCNASKGDRDMHLPASPGSGFRGPGSGNGQRSGDTPNAAAALMAAPGVHITIQGPLAARFADALANAIRAAKPK